MARLLRVLKWIVLTGLCLALLFVFGVAPYLLARFITHAGTRPRDRHQTVTPSDFGMAFENVSFPAGDGVSLKGWYLGGGDKRASVACAHGLFRSRREVLERSVDLRKAGYDVLLFDLRGHGESGEETITLGYKERLDVQGAVTYLEHRSPRHKLVSLGVSMGAAAALLEAAEDARVDAVIADSSFSSLEHTVSHHLELFWGLPRFPLAHELLFFIERQGGFRKEDLDVERAVSRIGARPILFVAGSMDRRMPVEVQRRLYRAAESDGSRFVLIEGASHGAGYRTDPETYRREMLEFLAPLQRVQDINASRR